MFRSSPDRTVLGGASIDAASMLCYVLKENGVRLRYVAVDLSGSVIGRRRFPTTQCRYWLAENQLHIFEWSDEPEVSKGVHEDREGRKTMSEYDKRDRERIRTVHQRKKIHRNSAHGSF